MHTYVLPIDFCREKPKRPVVDIHRICSPDRRRVDTGRRTTGGLLEVRRCALGSLAGTSLAAIWRSMRGRALV